MSNSSCVSDYEFSAIEAAIKKTTRGRAFLASFAQRARRSDTLTLLATLNRLERWCETRAKHSPELNKCAPEMAMRLPSRASYRGQINQVVAKIASADSVAPGALDDGVGSVRHACAVNYPEDGFSAVRDLEERVMASHRTELFSLPDGIDDCESACLIDSHYPVTLLFTKPVNPRAHANDDALLDSIAKALDSSHR